MPKDPQSFDESANARRTSLLGEFVSFLMQNKKWWLLPILLMFVMLALLVALSSTGAAPFIYTLF